MRKLPAAFLLLPIIVLLLNGCTEPLGEGLPGIDSENSTYHSTGWKDNPQHGNDFSTNPKNCKACHGGDLKGGSSSVSCASCHHGWDPGDMEPGPDCFTPGCHVESQSHTTHFDAQGKGPGILKNETGCSACHGEIVMEIKDGACDPCHSPGGAFDGSQMAKDNWSDGIYEAGGIALQSGKEQWCAGCHDDDPAYSRNVLVESIVDNGDASYVGTWPSYSSGPPTPTQFYGSDFQYHGSGSGTNSARWESPSELSDGAYSVYARWVALYNRATNVFYTINHSGGTDVVGPFDQTRDGGIWMLLGTFSFASSTGSVVLTDDVNGIVVADAIRFTRTDSLGTYAPNVIGNNTTYGFYANGHNISCLACHDHNKKHIDHEHRTYEVDETTRQAITAYEEGYRLRGVGGKRPMIIPQDITNWDRTPSHYLLCMKCHDSEPVLSLTRSGTNLWKEATEVNYHTYHLNMKTSLTWDSDWDAIMGNPNGESIDSIPSCPTCHNVHGSPSPTMTRHGELITAPGSPSKVPSFDFAYLNDVESRDPSITNAYPDSVGVGLTMGSYPESNNYNGICVHCHSGSFYIYRPPWNVPVPTNPKITLPKPVPSNIANDGTSQVLLTAVAVDPNGSLSSVEIDLTALEGIDNQAMYDDGTHGDVTAGDEIYSYLLSGPTVAVGNKKATITAKDSSNNTGTGEIVVVVHDEAQSFIVDNTEAAFTTDDWPSWSTGPPTPLQFFGRDFQYIGAGSGTNTATWFVRSDMPAGTYNLYGRWVEYSNRATNVYYTVNHSGGMDVIGPIDQTQDGGSWILLGTFDFEAGSGSVVLTDNANGIVVADAIKWELQ